MALARHILETSQLLCSSCQVIYLNTDDFELVQQFGRTFAKIVGELESNYELPLPVLGKLAIEKLTKELEQCRGRDCIWE